MCALPIYIGTAQGTLLAYQPRINPEGAHTAYHSPRVFLFALPQGRCATWHTPHDTPGAWHSLLGTLPYPGGQTGAGEHQGRLPFRSRTNNRPDRKSKSLTTSTYNDYDMTAYD